MFADAVSRLSRGVVPFQLFQTNSRRVFALGVLECPQCGGRMGNLCAIHPPEAIRKILECLGLPSRPPPIARAIPDREVDLDIS
jgi:hypothetical protein